MSTIRSHSAFDELLEEGFQNIIITIYIIPWLRGHASGEPLVEVTQDQVMKSMHKDFQAVTAPFIASSSALRWYSLW